MGVNLPWQTYCTEGGRVAPWDKGGWRMAVKPGAGAYRCAQVDDYRTLRRRRFNWQPPLRLSLQARVSAPHLPGTWGFGLWNDPFSFALGGAERRLPALPNAAWFFHASPQNHLALHDDHPANGFLAATFSSPTIPSGLLAAALPAAPLLFIPLLARRLRQAARLLVREDAVRLDCDVTAWHDYTLEWRASSVRFTVDGQLCLETAISPRGPLGLVMWIDNQFAAFTPQGRVSFGSLAFAETMWLDATALALEPIEMPEEA